VQEQEKNNAWVTWVYFLLLVAAMMLFVVGYVDRKASGDSSLLALGALAVIIPAAVFPIVHVLTSGQNRVQEVDQRMDKMIRLLESINDRSMISDTAKRIAFRESDREALRKAISEDIAKGDLDAALVLANDMMQTYGYKQEGEELRQQILNSRAAMLDKQVLEAVAVFDQMLARQEWDKASAEAKKIQRLFPDSPRVAELPRRVAAAKQAHKLELERQFLEAAKRDDVETAMELLKMLDHYLTEREAAPLLEVARGVIGKKRQNLGVQFKLAINDQEWADAFNVGQQIIRDFPNTKMADEVRDMLEVLRERALGDRDAAAT